MILVTGLNKLSRQAGIKPSSRLRLSPHRSNSFAKCSMGYSLLELMIVLVILGVMLSMATLSFSLSETDPSEDAATRLKLDVNLSLNEAIIDAEPIGLGFAANGYRFYRLDEETEQWRLIEQDTLLTKREWSEEMQVELRVAGQSVSLASNLDDPLDPQVFVFPTGEVTPFSITLQHGRFEAPQQLHFNAMGQVYAAD